MGTLSERQTEGTTAADPLQDWFMPPPNGWTADDLDRLPAGAPRVELLDGILIVIPPQRHFHSRVMRKLATALDVEAPSGWQVDVRMSIRLNRRNRPESDVLVLAPTTPTNPSLTWYRPEDVVLAIEVVSPDSEDRDREVKPRKFAQAGIPHYWRVEEENDSTVVHAYDLDRDLGTYVAVAVERGRLKLDRPFPLDLDITGLYP